MSVNIVKVTKRENPFVQIDKSAIEDSRLTFGARGLLAFLLAKPSDWEVRVNSLVNATPEGKERVQSLLRELRTMGYANLVSNTAGGGRFAGKTWIIYESPLVTDIITDDMSAHRQTEKPVVGENAPTTGKTDNGQNRQRAKPIIGKARCVITNNKSNTNNNTVTNNNNVTYVKDENKPLSSFPNVTSIAPPSSAAPPAAAAGKCLPFLESPVCLNGLPDFGQALILAGIPANTDFSYYFDRLKTWRADDPPKSGNWIKVAQTFISKDIRTNSLHTIQDYAKPTFISDSTPTNSERFTNALSRTGKLAAEYRAKRG